MKMLCQGCGKQFLPDYAGHCDECGHAFIATRDGSPARWNCVCGKPETPGVVHRSDAPCYTMETKAA